MSSNQDTPRAVGEVEAVEGGGVEKAGRGASVDNEIFESIRVARQVDQRRVASLSGPQKKELLAKIRQKELHRILLPDAPPHKRKMQRQSPEREACEMVPSTSASEQRTYSPLPSTSRSEVEAPVDSPPLIVVPSIPPAVVEFDSTNSEFDATVIDSDSDGEFDCSTESVPVDDGSGQYVNDMTEQQERIMDMEDRQNDDALRQLLSTDHNRFDWNRDKTTFKGKRETFMGTPGPTFEITSDTRPTDIFEQMIDVRFVDMLVTETNIYAAQKIASLTDANNIHINSRLRRWTPTDRPEMIAYLSLTIIMGLYPLPIEESYFSFNGFGTMPYISKIMSYNRYLLLKSMLHFNNNNTLTNLRTKTKLSKIQPVIDYFNDKFSSLYYPKQEIAIDESLMKWHGRLSFAQKINSKSARVGVKTYELCESASGYLWRFIVYTGKDKPVNNDRNRPDRTTDNDEDDSRTDNDNNRPDRTTDDDEDDSRTDNDNNRPDRTTDNDEDDSRTDNDNNRPDRTTDDDEDDSRTDNDNNRPDRTTDNDEDDSRTDNDNNRPDRTTDDDEDDSRTDNDNNRPDRTTDDDEDDSRTDNDNNRPDRTTDNDEDDSRTDNDNNRPDRTTDDDEDDSRTDNDNNRPDRTTDDDEDDSRTDNDNNRPDRTTDNDEDDSRTDNDNNRPDRTTDDDEDDSRTDNDNNRPDRTTDDDEDDSRTDNDNNRPDRTTDDDEDDSRTDNDNNRPDRTTDDDEDDSRTDNDNNRPDRTTDDDEDDSRTDNDNNRPDRTTDDDEDDSRTDNDNETRPDNDNDSRLTDQTQQTTDNDSRLSQTQPTTEIERPTNATAKIVIDLIEPLLGRGHTVIMDNFYNCPLLARYLKLQQTDCYGTQRLNREFIPTSMKTLTETDLRHGEVVASFCSDLTLIVWRDSKLVSMISTYHQLQIDTNEKYNKTTFKPSVILDYNKNMGGIDRKDQYLSAHQVERTKSRVWYKKVFRRLFNCAVFNCFVLFSTKHKLSHRQFRITLAESLLKTYRNIDLTTETRVTTRTIGQKTFTVRQQNCSAKKTDRPVVEGEHFPAHSQAKRGRCWWCFHKKRVTTRSVWMCQECKVNLCIIGCFRDYHKPDPDG